MAEGWCWRQERDEQGWNLRVGSTSSHGNEEAHAAQHSCEHHEGLSTRFEPPRVARRIIAGSDGVDGTTQGPRGAVADDSEDGLSLIGFPHPPLANKPVHKSRGSKTNRGARVSSVGNLKSD